MASVLVLSSLGLAVPAYSMPAGEGYKKCMHGEYKREHGGMHGKRGFDVDRLAEKLNLSDDQRSQMKVIIEESKPQISALREKMRENRKQLRELSQKTPFNETDVRKLAEAQGDVKAEMIVLRMQQRSQIQALLTEEQRVQMKEMREKKHWRR